MNRALLRTFLAAAAGFFTSTFAHAQLTWEKPAQEFQRAPEDAELTVQYAFKNTGSTPIAITSVAASCGCITTKPADKKTYAPGEGGAIEVRFTFGARRGPQHKVIAVKTSDGRQAALDLRCSIEDALTLAPALVFWRLGDAPDAKTVTLTLAHPDTLKVTAVKSSNPRLRAELTPDEKGQLLLVKIQPIDTTTRESAQIEVQTNSPPDAPKSYTIHARIK